MIPQAQLSVHDTDMTLWFRLLAYNNKILLEEELAHCPAALFKIIDIIMTAPYVEKLHETSPTLTMLTINRAPRVFSSSVFEVFHWEYTGSNQGTVKSSLDE